MCGILAVFQKEIYSDDFKSSLNLMQHRGPDDSGIALINPHEKEIKHFALEDSVKEIQDLYQEFPQRYFHNSLLFGHRRLSIIDLSYHGHQPMSIMEGMYTIVFNGEIFNYLELREQLVKLGYSFKTRTDTEVILYGYHHWKEELFEKLNGMWSFAIFDNFEKKLIISRDRYQIKPLFYYFKDGEFIFSSEMKPILSLIHNRELNEEQLHYYLAFGKYLPDNPTIFKFINEFPSGHYGIISFEDFSFQLRRYYKPHVNAEYGSFDADSFERHKSKFEELLFDAVKLRLRADVPVGTCLSGGFDSSVITLIINKILSERKSLQNTFTASFPGFKLDERIYAEEIVKKTSAHGHFVEVYESDLIRDIPDFIYHQEYPVGSFSPYALYKVMQLVKKHNVKVTLDGQGADELLGGYQTMYFPLYLKELINRLDFKEFLKMSQGIPKFSKLILQMLFIKFFPEHKKNEFIIKKNRLNRYLDITKVNNYQQHWADKTLNEILMDDLFYNVLPLLLRYEDYNSMAHSVEARLPFLDYRLVDFLLDLPAVYKIKDGRTKYLLQETFAKILPAKISSRRDKIGFAVPQVQWLKNNSNFFKKLIQQSEILKEYTNVKKILNDYHQLVNKTDRASTEAVLFRLINLSLWERIYLSSSLNKENISEVLQ